MLLGPIVEGDKFADLGSLEGITLRDLVDGEYLPAPPLMNWAGWRNWRRDHGCRPKEPPQNVGLKSAFAKREGRLHRELMESWHGLDWKTQLIDLQFQEEQAAEEAASLAAEAADRAALDVARERAAADRAEVARVLGVAQAEEAARLAAFAAAAAAALAPAAILDEPPAAISAAGSEVTAHGGDSQGVSSTELRTGTASGGPPPSDSGSSAAARVVLEGATEAVLRAAIFDDIDLPGESWDVYQRRVYRAMGVLQGKGFDVSTPDVDKAMMRNRYLLDAPQPFGPGSAAARTFWFRSRLRETIMAQEVPGGDTEENRMRVDTLFELAAARGGADGTAPAGNPRRLPLYVPPAAPQGLGVERPPGLAGPPRGAPEAPRDTGGVGSEASYQRPPLELGAALPQEPYRPPLRSQSPPGGHPGGMRAAEAGAGVWARTRRMMSPRGAHVVRVRTTQPRASTYWLKQSRGWRMGRVRPSRSVPRWKGMAGRESSGWHRISSGPS